MFRDEPGPLSTLWGATKATSHGLWGDTLIAEMQRYNHSVGVKVVSEYLLQERNTVTLAEDKDQYGLAIAKVTYNWCDNDKALNRHALASMRQIMEGAGVRELWDQTDDTCHMNGTARMGADPRISVVDADCRTWNLWICDGSVFPTVGGINPSLTIQAVALRTADRIEALARRGEL